MKKNHQLRKDISSFKKDSQIIQCFHFDHAECSANIIKAHSLQMNGVLSVLESTVNENSTIYSFLDFKYDENGKIIGFAPLGKKSASTFTGFCGFHDNGLFEEIEKKDFNPDDDKHCFLTSYRSFAKDFHAKIETTQGFGVNEKYKEPNLHEVSGLLIEGSELSKRDGMIVKNRLDDILKNGNFDELYYFCVTLEYTAPVAVACSFNPDYSYKNKLLNKSTDPNVIYQFVNLSVIPTNSNQTHIIFSCLPEHDKSILFLDELEELPDLLLHKAISSIIVGYAENTFISPKFWEQLSTTQKETLINELQLTNPLIRGMLETFFHSKINMFDEKYSLINSTVITDA